MRGALSTLALLWFLLANASGCALALAVGDSGSELLRPACPPAQVVGSPAGEKVTEHTEYNDKIGFKPQVESVTKISQPAPLPPEPEPKPVLSVKSTNPVGAWITGIGKAFGALACAVAPWPC